MRSKLRSTVPLHHHRESCLEQQNARDFEARCCCHVYRTGACDHQSAIFNDGDSRRRTQSRLHLARLWDGIGKPKLHTERPFLNMLVAASILTARNNLIDAWTLHCFIKASRSCKVAACTASLQHGATAPSSRKLP